MKPHAHEMRDTPERELPFKDALIVFFGTILAVLIMALITGWLLEQANLNVKRQTDAAAAVMQTATPVVTQVAIAHPVPAMTEMDLSQRLVEPQPHSSVQSDNEG